MAASNLRRSVALGAAIFCASGFSASATAATADSVEQLSSPELALTLLVLGMGSVFSGLTGIYLFLLVLRRVTNRPARSRAASALQGEGEEPEIEVTAEMTHAIALALYMDLRTFDPEGASTVTVRKVTRPFSPWWNAGKTQMQVDKARIFERRG
jgi:Na+-transporting methylmalonyl-CoA/oxaloacetate decarboxylase gamma subunit